MKYRAFNLNIVMSQCSLKACWFCIKMLTDFSDFMLNSLVIASINLSRLYFPRVGLVSLSIEEYCDKLVLLISQMAEDFVLRCRLCAFQISDC